MAKSSKHSSKKNTPARSSTKKISKGNKTLQVNGSPAKKSSKPKSMFTKEVTLFRDQRDAFWLDRKYKDLGFESRAIHAGNTPDQLHGGVVPSLDLSTTFVQPNVGEPSSCFDYTRCGNPTILNLQRNFASLEHAKFAFAFSSGMAATLTCMSLLKKGDHLICIDDVYGGTQRYLRKIFTPNWEMEWDMIDMQDVKKVKSAIKKNTKMVWMESPTNPTLKVTDIAAVAAICREKNVLLIVDSTFMSPALQNPLVLGADIVMHSVTKYMGGHSDVVAGALMFNDEKLYDPMFFNMKTMGTMIAPFDAWIALKGTKTLGLRMERASANALEITKYFLKHPKIEKVWYPGHPSHPHHKIAQKNRACKDQTGGSGMLSFYVKGNAAKVNTFLSNLKLITLAESLGGVESLIECPALMTHGSVPPAHRKMLGIDDNFVRLSTGIENIEDLIADLDQALKKI